MYAPPPKARPEPKPAAKRKNSQSTPETRACLDRPLTDCSPWPPGTPAAGTLLSGSDRGAVGFQCVDRIGICRWTFPFLRSTVSVIGWLSTARTSTGGESGVFGGTSARSVTRISRPAPNTTSSTAPSDGNTGHSIYRAKKAVAINSPKAATKAAASAALFRLAGKSRSCSFQILFPFKLHIPL